MTFVIGGGGSIGRAMCASDSARKWIAVDKSFNSALPVSTLRLDLKNRNGVQAFAADASEKCEVIFLAGKVSLGSSPSELEDLYQSNVVNLATFLEVFGPKISKLQFVSSISVYGVDASELINESSPLSPQSHYALSKLGGERVVLEAAKKFHFTHQIVRLAQVYGVATAENTFPHKLLFSLVSKSNFDFRGCPDSARDYIHVQDVARLLPALLDLEISGIFNLGGGEAYILGDVIEEAYRTIGSKWEPPANAPLNSNSQVLNSSKVFSLTQLKPKMRLLAWLAAQCEKVDCQGF